MAWLEFPGQPAGGGTQGRFNVSTKKIILFSDDGNERTRVIAEGGLQILAHMNYDSFKALMASVEKVEYEAYKPYDPNVEALRTGGGAGPPAHNDAPMRAHNEHD